MAQQQRYTVLERIDAGGMAEVFRGEATSIEGFSKTVAIKRVLPSLTRKRRFVRMFLDEARLSLGLNHANVVQVFDLGQADGTWFIVMEYVEGTNLRTVLEMVLAHRRPLPIAEAVYIMAEVCKGLSYAHRLTDSHGRDLEIVHRDISPPNILLSRQGEVKITDFGLAKARSQLEKTDPGIVKGKFGYLSPEAAYGEPIDHRTDIFAVGIVLWEMLAAQRLFNAPSEGKTLDLVRKALVPDLTRINPKVPAELDAVIRRALSRDRAARYADASELANDLTGILFDHKLKVGAYDIARLVEGMLGGGESGERELGDRVDDPYDHGIEDMIQAEIEHFVSLDDEGDGDGGGLEDPSTWFDIGDDDAGSTDEPAVELRGLRVGPQVTTISTAFPIQVMEEAIAAREGGLDWELREGGAPPVDPSRRKSGPEASDDDPLGSSSSISMAIPIDIIMEADDDDDVEVDIDLDDDEEIEIEVDEARDEIMAAREEIAADRLGRRGDDTEAWSDLEHLSDELDVTDDDHEASDVPLRSRGIDVVAPDGTPSPVLTMGLVEGDEDLKLSHMDAAEIGLSERAVGERARPHETDVARAAAVAAGIGIDDGVAEVDADANDASRSDDAQRDGRVVPPHRRRASEAMLAVVSRVEHVLHPRQARRETPARSSVIASVVVLLLLVGAIVAGVVWLLG